MVAVGFSTLDAAEDSREILSRSSLKHGRKTKIETGLPFDVQIVVFCVADRRFASRILSRCPHEHDHAAGSSLFCVDGCGNGEKQREKNNFSLVFPFSRIVKN